MATSFLQKPYQLFQGIYREKMPELIAAGFVPMNVADVMKARLEAVKGIDAQQKDFWFKYFNTGDGAAYRDGKIKVVYDALALKDVTPVTQLSDGALILTPEYYNALEGQEFSMEELERAGLSKRLTKSEVKSHPLWQALARDNHLLSEYVDVIFAEVKQIHNDDYAMRFSLAFEQDNPTMHPWVVTGIEGWFDGRGDYGFLYKYGINGISLIGVSSESTEDKPNILAETTETIQALGDITEKIQAYTQEDVKKARKQLTKLKKIVKPEEVSSLDELLRKL